MVLLCEPNIDLVGLVVEYPVLSMFRNNLDAFDLFTPMQCDNIDIIDLIPVLVNDSDDDE